MWTFGTGTWVAPGTADSAAPGPGGALESGASPVEVGPAASNPALLPPPAPHVTAGPALGLPYGGRGRVAGGGGPLLLSESGDEYVSMTSRGARAGVLVGGWRAPDEEEAVLAGVVEPALGGTRTGRRPGGGGTGRESERSLVKGPVQENGDALLQPVAACPHLLCVVHATRSGWPTTDARLPSRA